MYALAALTPAVPDSSHKSSVTYFSARILPTSLLHRLNILLPNNNPRDSPEMALLICNSPQNHELSPQEKPMVTK